MNANYAPNDDPHHGYLRRVIACFLVLLAAWGAADVVLTAASTTAPVMFTDREYVPGLGMAMRRGFRHEMSYVSREGFRRSELPRLVPGEIRILVLGDSVTFGLDTANGPDWPAMLEKYLRAHGVHATVMNAGNPGARTDYIFAALAYYAARTKFDVVLVQNTGNMLALGHDEPGLKAGVEPVIDRLFPGHSQGSLRTRAECPDMSVVRETSPDTVSLPAIARQLSAHSPAWRAIGSVLADRSAAPSLAHAVPIPDRCFAPASGTNYLVREMIGMAQMTEYAARERMKIFFLRPSYAFNWARRSAARSSLPAAYRDGYQGSWAPVENVDRIFDFFQASGAGMLDPVSRLMRESGDALGGAQVARLYEDHTHFSAEGARLIAQAVGEELIARDIVTAASIGPWTHPAENANAGDLRYRDIPGALSFGEVAMAAILASMVVLAAGLALGALLPAACDRYAAAPMLGFLAVFGLGALANNFSFDPFPLAIVAFCAAAATVVFLAATRRLAWRRLAVLASIASLLALASAALITHSLGDAGARRVDAVRTQVALAEYLAMGDQRPSQVDLFKRQVSDGIARPHRVVDAVASYPHALQPAEPALAAYLSRATGLPVHDAVIGSLAAFCAAISLFAFAASWPLRQKRAGAAIPAAVAATALVVTTLCFPSALTMAVAAALCMIYLALRDREPVDPRRFAMLLAAGVVLYPLPATLFVVLVGALVIVAGASAFWGSRDVGRGMAGALVVLVGLLGARALLFNVTILDPRLYLLLAHPLGLSPFFL